jgi:hypothetical protein
MEVTAMRRTRWKYFRMEIRVGPRRLDFETVPLPSPQLTSRPDMFPRLHSIGGKPGRLDGLGTRTHNSTIFLRTGGYEHIFPSITQYLDLSSLYNLAAACKELRYYSLTEPTYQLTVRNAIRETQWAMPVASEIPDKVPDGYPDPNTTGDWLLYGTHIHKTNSMRNRRRIFNLMSQMESQYITKATDEGYLNGPNSKQMQNYLRASLEQQLLIRKLNGMFDYDLFVKCMKIFNQAYKEDLKSPRFTGTQMPIAVENVKKEMRGKKALAMRQPGRAAKEMNYVIKERMKSFMVEKHKCGGERTFVPVREGLQLLL